MARSREEMLKAKREGMARLRARDPEAARRKRNEWHAKNRDDQIEKMRKYYARRFFWGRAMKLRGADRASHIDVARLWKKQRGKCALTGRALNREAQLDHILPRARGGNDKIANLRWVCAEVNISKRNMTDAEYFAVCCDVMRWIGERIAMVDEITSEDR